MTRDQLNNLASTLPPIPRDMCPCERTRLNNMANNLPAVPGSARALARAERETGR